MKRRHSTRRDDLAPRDAAQSLIATSVFQGVEVCFSNPGTTELPLVQALDSVAGMRAVLCLFEGVCSAAADGNARMTGEPAMTLLHLGPGFANAIANLHNARRAHTPVFNVVGTRGTVRRTRSAAVVCVGCDRFARAAA